MRPIEVSTDIALPPRDAWDVMWSNGGAPRFLAEMHELGYWRDVTAVEDYEVRDGLPRYRMTRKFGPLPPISMATVYDVFEPPRRAVNRPVGSPLQGDFVATYEPTAQGTRVTWRWGITSPNPVLALLLRVLRPVLVRALQQDLREYGRAAVQRRTQWPEEGAGPRR